MNSSFSLNEILISNTIGHKIKSRRGSKQDIQRLCIQKFLPIPNPTMHTPFKEREFITFQNWA